MRFHLALLSLVASAVAQSSSNANAFKIPSSGNYLLTAGQPQTFEWSNPAGSTVTLLLRIGANSDLKTVSTIASNIPNSGSYTWTPPSDIPESANYAIEIIDDQDTSQVNYTPQFVIQSNVKAVATSGGATSLVTATTAAPATGSTPSSMMTVTSSAATATGSSAAASSTGSASSASASASASASKSASASASAASGSAAPAPSSGAAHGYTAGSSLLAVAVAFAIAM